jgi:hypothetical protein
MSETTTCSAKKCPLPAEEHADLCVLHIPRDGKNRQELKEALAKIDEAGIIRIRDLYLVDADLTGINLYLKNLQYSDLTGASLQNARLRKVGFDFSKLDEVNFESAILEKCDLRRATSARDIKWFEVILDGVQIPSFSHVGLHTVYEDGEDADLTRAQFVFRQFKEGYKNQGDHDASGLFYEREMDMNRRSGGLLERAWLTLLWVLCGYGEKPMRSVAAFFVTIFGFAVGFYFCDLRGPEGPIRYDYFKSLYFSVVTFTSLGYGDVTPRGFARFLAGSEALLGVFLISLFVFVFCRRMVR